MKRIFVSKIGFYRNPFNGVRFPNKSQALSYMRRRYCFSVWRGHLKHDNRFLPYWQFMLPAFNSFCPKTNISFDFGLIYPINFSYEDSDLPF